MRLVSDDTWAILTIWQESRGEDDAGKLAVAEVIRNRTESRYSSDGTVAGTVLRPLQFSGWNTKDPNRTVSAMIDTDDPTVQACIKAWYDAKAGSQTVHGAVLYFNPKIVKAPDWAAKCELVATVGDHWFYIPTPAGA